MTDRRLDRIPYFDARSRGFAAIASDDDRPVRSYTWSCDVFNDQGQEGACVGFAWSHELSARPKVIRVDADFARSIYHTSQEKYDPWPGTDYSGTSVLGGVKAVQEHVNAKGNAYIKEYRWAFGIEDLCRVIGYQGPAVLGIPWYTGMWNTDSNGFIHKTGTVAGGHAILARAVKIVRLDPNLPADWQNVDIDKSYIVLHNSWGKDWGVNGTAKISVRDMSNLLDEDGEACIPVIRSFA